jgi:hypothetical protein
VNLLSLAPSASIAAGGAAPVLLALEEDEPEENVVRDD